MKATHALKRLAKIAGVWGVLHIVDTLYDYVLYPLVIAYYGTLLGGVVMTAGSALICLIFLVMYEKSGQDWLGVNVIEEVKEKGQLWVTELVESSRKSALGMLFYIILFIPSHIFIICIWAVKKGDVLAFIALSIIQDPFKTTVYLRHGRFGGLKRKDWYIFWASVVLSNGWWICLNSLALKIIKTLYSLVI